MVNRLKGFLGLRSKVLGIALENETLHWIEVMPTHKGCTLRNIKSLDNFKEYNSTAIRQRLLTIGVQAKQAVVSIDCRQVFFRAVTFPHMKEKELLATVRWEVQRHVPYEEDTYYYDCAVIGSDIAENKSTVMIVAVKKEIIAMLKKSFADLAIQLIAVESDIFSLARLVKTVQDYMIISMRRNENVAMAYQGRAPFFVRSFGFNQDDDRESVLLQAVVRSMEQYKLQRRIQVEKVYLCGDCIDVDVVKLSAECGVEVELLCPDEFFSYDTSFAESDLCGQAMQAAAAIGAVWRGDVRCLR